MGVVWGMGLFLFGLLIYGKLVWSWTSAGYYNFSEPSKGLLRDKALNYLEVKGDCYLRDDHGLFWFFRGRQAVLTKRLPKHRLFHKNGVKLVFAFLLEPELVNASYRQMAERAGISVGTVGDILLDLMEAGFVLPVDEKKRILNDEAELLEKWTRYYLDLVKPKQLREHYRFARMEDRRDWRSLALPIQSWWGGEPAADLYTNYLAPAAWTLYSALPRNELIRTLRLIPDPEGEVAVYAPFWGEELKGAGAGDKVHPILVYADLIDSGDPRNLETAKKLYEQEIRNIL
jgi:hypothetical protein